MADEQAAQNTDRELWRDGDFPTRSIHVTTKGEIGINVGGTVVVQTVEAWHKSALPAPMPDVTQRDKHGKPAPDIIAFCGSQYTRADLAPDTARIAALEEENARLREEVRHLQRVATSNLLPGLLDQDETDALVDFVKSIRADATTALGEQP